MIKLCGVYLVNPKSVPTTVLMVPSKLTLKGGTKTEHKTFWINVRHMWRRVDIKDQNLLFIWHTRKWTSLTHALLLYVAYWFCYKLFCALKFILPLNSKCIRLRQSEQPFIFSIYIQKYILKTFFVHLTPFNIIWFRCVYFLNLTLNSYSVESIILLIIWIVLNSLKCVMSSRFRLTALERFTQQKQL